jgi:chorismate synthase
VAEKVLHDLHKTEIVAWVSSVGMIDAPDLSAKRITRTDVDATDARCPDKSCAAEMADAIREAAAAGDSLGGIITCVCRNVPAGWGEPVFDKANALLGHAMLSIPAAKGVEIGSGFAGTRLLGSEHNDMFIRKGRTLGTITNHSGGIQGGITNGEPIIIRVAFKPTATIRRAQRTANYTGKSVVLEVKEGRHDPCVLPRAVPVVEAMAALVLADLALVAAS